MTHVVFLRAANVGGRSVFSPAALSKKLGLINIGAAGTFVSPRRISAKEIAKELRFETDIVVRPASEVIELVDAGPPDAPKGTHLFVSVLVRGPAKKPSLPFEWPAGRAWALRAIERRGAFVVCVRRIEMQRGLDLSAILERAFGVRATTRSWGTMERIVAAIRTDRVPYRAAPRRGSRARGPARAPTPRAPGRACPR